MIAEAMAHGKPVVATRVGGIPELVHDQESGYLVNSGAINAMSGKVMALLDNEVLRKRMGSVGKNIVQEKFNLSTNVAKLIDCYGLKECGKIQESIPTRRFQEGLS